MTDHNSIQELIERDPLQLTDRDLTAIIEHFRKTRVTFLTTGKAPSAVSKPTKAQKLIAELKLDLGDISL